KTVLQRTLLGSVSQDVIRLSVKPVFIFKRKLQYFSQGVQLNSIMYATAFKSIDSKVMPYLAYEGLRAEKLVIMNVGARAPDPAAEKKRVAAVQQDLDRLKSECQSGYKKTETVIAIGSARRKIVKQARKLDVDLIVTGKNDRAGGKDAVLGSTAEYIPHHAACSVMIIPGG
ncbi:MAG TPA: universal stress protein, partial [Spirochaetota bacterium]|nr:universal stress protein [Spirochaetota bacterium]